MDNQDQLYQRVTTCQLMFTGNVRFTLPQGSLVNVISVNLSHQHNSGTVATVETSFGGITFQLDIDPLFLQIDRR